MWELSQEEVTNSTYQIIHGFHIMENFYVVGVKVLDLSVCRCMHRPLDVELHNKYYFKVWTKAQTFHWFLFSVMWSYIHVPYLVWLNFRTLIIASILRSRQYFENGICFHPQVRGCEGCCWVQYDRRSCSQLLDNMVYVPASKYAPETELAKSL